MAKYTKDTKQNSDLHQQMPAQNLTPEVDIQGIQHYTRANDQAIHRKLNKDEQMKVDRTHTQETSRNHHPSSHHMEPLREWRRGTSRNTWQRDTERETKEMG